jgi:hypothetical protein
MGKFFKKVAKSLYQVTKTIYKQTEKNIIHQIVPPIIRKSFDHLAAPLKAVCKK